MPGLKCDNCGDNHYVSHCPKRRDGKRIKAAVEAQRAKRAQGGGDNKQGGGGGGTRYNQSKFGQGNWKPPSSGETVHKINKKIYCACQKCGRATGSSTHYTGKHDEYVKNPDGFPLAATHPYMIELSRSGKMPAQDGNPSTRSGENKKLGGIMGLATLAAQAMAFEKDTDNAETSVFTGKFDALLTAISKMTVKY